MSAGRNKHSRDRTRKNQRTRALKDRLDTKIAQKLRRKKHKAKNKFLKSKGTK